MFWYKKQCPYEFQSSARVCERQRFVIAYHSLDVVTERSYDLPCFSPPVPSALCCSCGVHRRCCFHICSIKTCATFEVRALFTRFCSPVLSCSSPHPWGPRQCASLLHDISYPLMSHAFFSMEGALYSITNSACWVVGAGWVVEGDESELNSLM